MANPPSERRMAEPQPTVATLQAIAAAFNAHDLDAIMEFFADEYRLNARIERFRQLGCSGCHSAGSSVHAPALEGLLGRTVHLQDGRSLVADATYVRDSILLPRKDVVAGFEPVMPSFAGQVSEEDIQALVAYLQSTGDGTGGTR